MLLDRDFLNSAPGLYSEISGITSDAADISQYFHRVGMLSIVDE